MGCCSPNEMKILKSMRNEWDEYYKPFNHDQWFPKEGKAAIEIWRDGLLKALETGIRYEWIPEEHTLDI